MSELVYTYKAEVSDQRLRLAGVPRLASGAVGTVGFGFTGLDSGIWAGRTVTVVFWRSEKEVYHVLAKQGVQDGQQVRVAVVPAEVMAEQGAFYLGLMGTAEGSTITTDAIRLNVFQGAITTPTASPAEPTPDVYSQLLEAYAIVRSSISELVAMKGVSGETVITMSGDDYVKDGTIRLNGATAVLTFEIDGLTLSGYGEHSTDGCIQPDQAPLFPDGQDIPMHCSNPDLDVFIKKDEGDPRWSYIKIVNRTGSDIGVYGATCWGFFPLASVTVPEVVDARVDHTGKAWPTLGDHLRDLQIKAIQPTDANTLKGAKSGATVEIDDASPFDHEIKVKLDTDFKKEYIGPLSDYGISWVFAGGEGDYTILAVEDGDEYPLVCFTDEMSYCEMWWDYNLNYSPAVGDVIHYEPNNEWGEVIYLLKGFSGDPTTVKVTVSCPEGTYMGGPSAGDVGGTCFESGKTKFTVDYFEKFDDGYGNIYFTDGSDYWGYLDGKAINSGDIATISYTYDSANEEYSPVLYILAAAKYFEPREVTPNADGIATFYSGGAEEMNISNDKGAVLNVDYNRDINKVIARIEEWIGR